MADTKNPKPTAADKRKEADAELEKRIAGRKAASVKGALAKGGVAKAEPEAATSDAKPAKPATPSALPFVPTSPAPAAASPTPEKKARKPREAKLKAAPDAELADLINAAKDKAVKAALKEQAEQHKAILKGTVDKSTHDNELKAAYEKGVADGKKQALAGVKATLKGA